MSTYALWLDHEHAKVFHFTPDKLTHFQLKHHQAEHHSAKNQSDLVHKKFFDEIRQKLKGADRLMVMGPGTAKNHFKNYLDEHDKGLAKKIVAFKTVDHPTDHQLVAIARELLGEEILWKGLNG